MRMIDTQSPLNSATLLTLVAVNAAMEDRVATIARRCFASRGVFRKYEVGGDVGGANAPNHQTACFESFEMDGTAIKAHFSWWWGDESMGTTVHFPLDYLDMTDDAIQAELTAEREAANARSAEADEAARLAAAEKTEAAARADYERLKARFEKPPPHA